VLESYVPAVEDKLVNGKKVEQAYQLVEGCKISLASEDDSLQNIIGEVKRSNVEYEPCVRVITEKGVSLVCSMNAPLFTKELTFTDAPETMGKYVAVMVNGATSWDKVVEIEQIGNKFVAVIDAGGTAFWAGEKPEQYILHHNVKIGRGAFTSELVSYDKK
jgi:hypothetical protein